MIFFINIIIFIILIFFHNKMDLNFKKLRVIRTHKYYVALIHCTITLMSYDIIYMHYYRYLLKLSIWKNDESYIRELFRIIFTRTLMYYTCTRMLQALSYVNDGIPFCNETRIVIKFELGKMITDLKLRSICVGLQQVRIRQRT